MNKTNQKEAAINLLKKALLTYPDDTTLISQFVTYCAQLIEKLPAKTVKKAFEKANQAIFQTLYSDITSLKAWITLQIKAGKWGEAAPLIDHALIMSPKDEILLKYKKAIKNRCFN
jgi:hypothetical protein